MSKLGRDTQVVRYQIQTTIAMSISYTQAEHNHSAELAFINSSLNDYIVRIATYDQEIRILKFDYKSGGACCTSYLNSLSTMNAWIEEQAGDTTYTTENT